MGNPFDGKFKAFATALGAKNAQDHQTEVTARSAEVYADKPFSTEYATLYRVALVGQTLSQIITFCTTAGLGVFALEHIIPLWWGVFIAVPLGIAFAFGVEKVKRSTLSIASKHVLKYKSFGFVGIVAALALCVSIAAALYGAKELPGVVYPTPKRGVDAGNVAALNEDIARVQSDIDRVQSNLKSGKNWIAENRTLPKLQQQRAALVERRDAAIQAAEGKANSDHAEALADRAAKVEKMQVYSVGAAVIAELAFLLCTAFVLYYLFRHYAERQAAKDNEGEPGKGASVPEGGFIFYQNGKPSAPPSGAPLSERRPIGFHRDPLNELSRAHDNAMGYASPPAAVVVETDKSLKPCAQCGTLFRYRTTWQKFCSKDCKLDHHEAKRGSRFDPAYKRKPKAAAV